tara:strand:+ start:1123 stop:1302 length:180 start_codon:yes stop_codon:yes gene_type:complete
MTDDIQQSFRDGWGKDEFAFPTPAQAVDPSRSSGLLRHDDTALQIHEEQQKPIIDPEAD